MSLKLCTNVVAFGNIFALMFRCTAEISSWTSEVLKQVEEVREELMEEVEQVHAEAEVRMADVSYVVNGIYTGKCYQGGN